VSSVFLENRGGGTAKPSRFSSVAIPSLIEAGFGRQNSAGPPLTESEGWPSGIADRPTDPPKKNSQFLGIPGHSIRDHDSRRSAQCIVTLPLGAGHSRFRKARGHRPKDSSERTSGVDPIPRTSNTESGIPGTRAALFSRSSGSPAPGGGTIGSSPLPPPSVR